MGVALTDQELPEQLVNHEIPVSCQVPRAVLAQPAVSDAVIRFKGTSLASSKA